VDLRLIIETTGRYLDFARVAVMVIGAVVSVPLAIRRRNLGEGSHPPNRSLYREWSRNHQQASNTIWLP